MGTRRYRVRDLLARLSELGGVAVRQRGSHQVVALPSGRCCTLKVNHQGEDVSPIVLATVRRVVREEGFEL